MVPPKFVSPLRCATLMAAALMIAGPAPQAQAANYFWDTNAATTGLGGAGTWDTTGAPNWFNAGVATTASGTGGTTNYTFTSADKAYFAGTSGAVTLATNATLGGIVFRNAAFTINSAAAQSLTLGSSGIALDLSAGLTTLGSNVGLVLGANQAWTNGSPAALVVNGVISGSGSLSLDGGTGGIQLLNGASTFTGSLTWSTGILQVTKLANGGVASTIGAATNDASNLNLAVGTTFKWVGDGVAATNDSTDRLFTLGALAGAAGGLTFDASPTVDSTKALRFTNTGTLGVPGGVDTYVRTLTFTGTGGTVANPNLFAPIIPDNGDTINLTSNTGLVKDGPGVWKFTGINSFAGPVQILNGTLIVTNVQDGLFASGLGASDAGNGGNNLLLGGVATAGTLRFEGSGGVDNRTNRIFKINAGGATIDASGAAGTPLIFKAFASLSLGGTTARTLTLTGTNTDGNYLAQIIPDYSLAAPTSVVKNGTGTWLLKGESTYTGGTTVNAGILRMAEGHTAFGTGTIMLNGGMLDLGTSVVETTQGANKYYTGKITVQGGELAALAGGSIDVFKVEAIWGTISAPMYSLTSGLLKNTANTLVITGYNRYMGGTNLSQGTIQVGHNFAFGATGAQILVLSGTPTLSSASTTAYVLPNNLTLSTANPITLGDAVKTGALTFTGTADLGSAVRTLAVNSDITFTGLLSGTGGGISKSGPGTLTLAAASSFNGGVTIGGGRLRVGNNAALGTGTLTLNDTAVLSSNNFTGAGVGDFQLANSLALGGDVTLGHAIDNGTLTFSNTIGLGAATTRIVTVNSDVVFSGVISGAGSNLTKAGPSLLTVSNSNTFNGVFAINAGTVRATVSANALGQGTLTLAGGSLQLANDGAVNFARPTIVSASSSIIPDRINAGAGVGFTLGTLSLSAGTLSSSVGNFVTSGATGVTFGAATLTGAATISTDNSLIFPATNTTILASLTRTSQILTVAGTGNLTITGTDTATSGALIKNGTGTLTLGTSGAGVNAGTGSITITGGAIVVGAGASFTSAKNLIFNGSGLFQFNAATTATTQNFGSLSFTSGGGAVQSVYTSGGNAALNFSAIGSRTNGADALFVVKGGSNGTTNKITFTTAPWTAGTLKADYFFASEYPTTTSLPADFAVYDTGSFVRAVNWGSDTTLATTVAASAALTTTKANWIIATSGTTGTVTQASGITINGLKLSGNATLVANGLVNTPSVLASENTTSNINGTIGLTAPTGKDLIVRVDAPNDTLYINAPITSATTGGLTKAGQGILVLTGNSGFSGNIFINGGTLSMSGTAYNGADPATGPLGGAATARQIILNGGKFQLSSGIFNPNFNTKQFTVGTGGGALDLGASAVIKLDDVGQLSGGGNLSITGTSTSSVTFSNTNSTFTGNVSFMAGTLVLGGVNPLGTSASQTLVMTSNTTALDVQGTIPNTVWIAGAGLSGGGAVRSSALGGTLSGPVNLDASTTFNLANPVTISGSVKQVGGTFSLTKEGISILTLTGANNFTGGLTINNGAVNLGNTAAAGPGGSTITLNSTAIGTALQLSGGITVYNPLSTGSSNNQLFGGINFGGILQNVSGNNTYVGAIGMAIDTAIGASAGSNLTILGGIQENTKESQLYFTGAGNITLAGTKLTASGGSTNNQFYSIQKYGTGTLTITNAQDVVLDGSVNGGAFILRQGTVNLTGDATWRTPLYLDQGSTLLIDHATGDRSTFGRLSTAYIDVNGAFQNGTGYNVTFRGGNLTITGSASPNDTAEYFSSGTFNRGSSVITLKTANGNATRVKFTGSITNNVAQSQGAGPAGASLLIRGTNLGASLGDAILWWNGIITWNGQGGGNDAKNKGIMSWVLVDATETGFGTSFGTADGGSSYARALNQQVYDNGAFAAGTPFTNEYEAVNVITANYNLRLTTQVSVTSTVSPNSLTVEAGAGLTLSPGVRLSLQSGGILIRNGVGTSVFTGGVLNQTSNFSPLYLWTIGNLDLVTPLNGGNGVTNGNISAVKASAGTLSLKPPFAAVNGLTTQGTNTLSGQFVINDGTVKLFANNAIQPNNYLALTSGTLDLNGKVQHTYALFSDSSVPNVNGVITSTAGGALVVNQDNNARAWSGQIQGATTFVRSGQNTFTLNSALPFTGNALFNGGTTNLISEAALTGVGSIEIAHATLQLDNGGSLSSNAASTKYVADRLRDGAAVSFRAATLNLYGRANVAASETMGAVTLYSGFNVINVNNGANGAVYSEDLLMASLTRSASSSATFILQTTSAGATLGGAGIGDVRAKATTFEGGTGLTNGIVGGWAINNSDFLTYVVGTGFVMLGNNSTSYTTTNLPSGSAPTSNVRLTGGATVAAGTTTINALSLAGTSQSLNFTNATDILNLVSGGLIGTNNNNSLGGSVDSGRLTAGGAAPAAPSDLYFFNRLNTMTLNARVIDNPIGGANAPVRLVLTASGGAINLPNTLATYTGGTVINGGTINLVASTAGAVIPAATVAANGLVLNGATVNMGSSTNTVSGQIAAANIVTLNGSSILNLFGNNSLAGLIFNNYGGSSNPSVRTFFSSHPAGLGSTGVLTIGASGIVATSQNVGTVATVEGRVDFAYAGATSLTPGTVTVDPISGAGVTDISPLLPGLTLQAIVGSGFGITKSGNGVLQMGAQSSFTGPFTVAAGGLRNGVLNAGSRYSTLTVASGARYDLANFTTTWGALAGAGDVFNSTLAGAATQVIPTLNVGHNNASTTFSGRFQRFNDAVIFNFAKVGTGTLTLDSAQTSAGTYGTFSVLGGTLSYAGASGQAFIATTGAASNFLVSNGGTLLLDNSSANLSAPLFLANAGRLGLAEAGFLAIQGGKLRVAGFTGADTVETIKLLKVQSGGGRIELAPAAGRAVTLALGRLTTPNNSGSLVITGIDGVEPVGFGAKLTIVTVPYQGNQFYGSNGNTNMKVRGDILVDASITGYGTGFLVQDSDTYNFRALNSTTELNADYATLGKQQNAGLSVAKTYAGDLQMNTLTSSGTSSLTSSLDATTFGAYGPGGRLLTLGLYNASGVLVRANAVTTLNAGAVTSEGTTYLHVLNGATLNLNASYGVGGSAGFVKTGDGILNLNRRAYMAPLNLTGGYTAIESDIVTVNSTAGLSIGSQVTGAGIPINSFVSEILDGGTQFRITSGEGVVTAGSPTTVITASPAIHINGGTLNLNAGADNSLAVAALAGPAGLSTLFVNAPSALVDLNGTSQAIAILGSTNILPGTGGTITNTSVTAALLTSAGGGSFGGVIGGNLAFTRSGNSTTLLTNANTYTGATIVRGGTLQLRDAGTLASTAGLTVYYGSVNWDNYGLNPVGVPTPTRIQATNAVTLQGGAFILTGGGGTDTVVTLNSLTAAGGGNLINMQPYINEGSSIKLTIGNLVRNAANHATFNLNGWTTLNSGGSNTLGSQGLSNTSNLFFTQVGGSTFNSGSLVNNLIGGWAVADGNAFATYTDTFGVVSLGNGWGYSTSFTGNLTAVNSTTAAGNYNDDTSRTMSPGLNAMNSLRISTSTAMTVTPWSGTTYTFGVGLVTNAGVAVTFEAVDSTNTISGTGSELFVYINQNTTTLKPIISGSASLVSFGGATLQLAPQFGHNTYSGGTFVNGGTLNLNARGQVSQGSGTITAASNTISLSNTSGFTTGMMIYNANFPGGTKIVTVNANTSLILDNLSTNTSTQTGQTVSSFDAWYAIPAAGGLTISNASVNMSATAFQQIAPTTAITINGGGNLTLPNYAIGTPLAFNAITQTFASLTFVNQGGANAPTFNLGNPSVASGSPLALSITQLTSATPLTATNNSLSTTPTVSTGNANFTELRFSAVSPVITVNSGLAETGLVISAVIGQSATMTSLAKAGSGLLALTGQNNFTSNFILNAGGLMLGADSQAASGASLASGPVGSGTLIINGGYLLSDGMPRTVNNLVTLNADLTFGGNVATTNLKLSGAVTLGSVARTVTVTSPAVTAELAGNLTSTFATVGGTAFTKAGPGTLKLSGPDNNFNGKKVAITGGLLVLGVSTAIPSTSPVAVSAGTGLDLFNFDLIIPQLTGAGFVTNSKNQTSTLTVGDAGSFTFGGILIDNSYSTGVTGSKLQLTKEGVGKMTLTGVNLLTGGINVNDGILELGTGGLPGPSTITITNNVVSSLGIFQINRADNVTLVNDLTGNGQIYHVGTGTTTLTGNGDTLQTGSKLWVKFGGVNLGDGVGSTGSLGGATVTVDTGTFLALNHSSLLDFFFANAVDGAGELRHTGGSTTTLGATNTYTGKTRINAGILIAGADSALAATSEIILLTGTQLKTTLNNAIGNRDGTFTSTIAPALTLNGTALVDGNGFNSTIGLLTLNGGTVAGASTGDTMIGSFNLAGNIVVTANAEISAVDVNTDGANRNVTVSPSVTLTMSGNFADTDKLATGYAKLGTGTMVLSGANLNSGTITISAGTLQVGAGGSTGTLGSYDDSIALQTFWAPVTNNAAMVLNRAGTYDLGNVISGAGSLANTGPGIVMLTGNSVSFSGTTTITAGTLQIGNLGTSGVLGGAAGVYGAIVDNAALVLKRTGTLTLGNAISGSGTVTNAGSGTVVITGNNTYTGTTTLAAGFTRVTSLASAGGVGTLGVGSAPSKLLFTGGTLEYNGAGETSQRGLKVADGGASLKAIQSGAAVVFGSGVTLDFDNTTPATTSSRPLTLSGTSTAANTFAPAPFESESASLAFSSLTKNLVGVWIVGGSGLLNTTAPVNVTAGILGFTSGAFGGGAGNGDVTISNGATLRWESGNLNDLSGRIHVPNAATATLDFADTGATPTTFATSMVLGTGASINKAGAGTVVFAAANSFTAPISVSGGKLVVTNASALGSAAVTVKNTATLQVNAITANNITVEAGGIAGGSGSVGLVTVNTTGAVAPGSGVGALNLSTLSLANGSVVNWQVFSGTGTAGVGYDTFNLSGALDLHNAYPTGRIRLNVISVAGLGTDTQGNAGAYTKNMRGVFTFAVAQGGVTLNSGWPGTNINDYFDINVDQFRYYDGSASNAALWSLTFDGANTVTLTGVPEPSTYGLAIGALGLALAAVRRRRKLKAKAE